jgi:hypothetical protein
MMCHLLSRLIFKKREIRAIRPFAAYPAPTYHIIASSLQHFIAVGQNCIKSMVTFWKPQWSKTLFPHQTNTSMQQNLPQVTLHPITTSKSSQ